MFQFTNIIISEVSIDAVVLVDMDFLDISILGVTEAMTGMNDMLRSRNYFEEGQILLEESTDAGGGREEIVLADHCAGAEEGSRIREGEEGGG